MHVIRVRNVQEALPIGIKELHSRGIPLPSRAGDVIVHPLPVTTVYNRPTERVIFHPQRDANPFFHLFEGLWMLAGREDGRFLDRFVKDFSKRFSDYSEDPGKSIHGAYGYRWKEGHQLDTIINYLRSNPFGRRAVLQMWDKNIDLFQDEHLKDVPCNTQAYFWNSAGRLSMTVTCRSNDIVWGCLSGDTNILSPEGNISIANLTKKFEDHTYNRYPVYSVDPKTGNMALKWCNRVWKTGIKPVRKLIFDDGTSLKLTSDHLCYLKKTRRGVTSIPSNCIIEINAGSLKIGDRIWAPVLFERNQRLIFKKNVLNNTGYSNSNPVHQAYYEFLNGSIPIGYDVHHKNENTLDNSKDNLEVLTHSEHMSLHMKKKLNNMTMKERIILAKKGSIAAAKAESLLSSEELADLNHRRTVHCSQTMKNAWNNRSKEEIRKITAPGLTAANTVNERHRVKSNHKIVDIIELSPEPVYDLTVDDYHTVLVGNGILVHNCYGANAVHFSMLQEYMAAKIGWDVGYYWQVSNNFHAYSNILSRLSILEPMDDPYETGTVKPFPLVSVPETWDRDLRLFFEDPTSNGYEDPFFHHVAKPMWWAHAAFSKRSDPNRFAKALEILDQCQASDWKLAASEWIHRRAVKGE